MKSLKILSIGICRGIFCVRLFEVRSSCSFSLYSKTCLNRTLLGLKNLFSLDRFKLFRQVFGLDRFKLHRHLVDGTVKSVWLRQVFGLLRVQYYIDI